METVKIFSLNPKTIGNTVTLPLIGDKVFDSVENSIEVDSDKVDEFLTLDCGIPFSTEDPRVKKSKDQEAKEFREQISGFDEKELRGLLNPYPKKQTQNLKTREDIIEYLVKQI
jgi:hypothetical protein